MKDFTCDMNCPIKMVPPPCCRRCGHARGYFLSDTNKKYWTDRSGFWSRDGCKLPRDQMPPKCRSYDCRQYRWYELKSWSAGKWKVDDYVEVKPNEGVSIIKKKEKE